MSAMRVKQIQQSYNLSYGSSENKRARLFEDNSIHKKSEQKQLNKEECRPAERLSLSGSERSRENASEVAFTGDPRLVTKIAKETLANGSNMNIPQWAEKMGGAEWFKKVLHSVNKNETFYEALVALGVAGILKPICVLAMPGAEREDKEMSATKNAVSAFAGFVLSNLILSPCSTAVNKITKSFDGKNPQQYIKDIKYIDALKSEELMAGMKSTLGDSFKTTYKKVWDVGVSPLKAGITLALMPYVLKAIFGDKKKKKKEEDKPQNPLNNMTVMNSIRMNNNKPAASSPSFAGKRNDAAGFENAAPSFTGGVSQIIDITKTEAPKKIHAFAKAKEAYCNILAEPIAKFMGKISTTTPAKKLVETFARFEKPSARWSDMASFAITYFYINNTKKSEKIDEERKLPLMINNFMVTVASSTAALLIDKYKDKPMENILKGYLKKHECELLDKSNISIVKTLKNAVEGNADADTIKNLTRHSEELLEGMDKKGLSNNLADAITALKNNDIVQKAVKQGIIKSEDISKMVVSGFEKQASSVFKNIMKTKSLTVFTLTVRFLVTVLMTPVIGKVVAMVNKKLGKDKEAKQKDMPSNVPPAGSETLGMKDYMNSLNLAK